MKGRPSRREENAVKMISVRMTKDEVALIENVIDEYEDLSRSDFIREAIFTYAEQLRNKKVVSA